MIELRQSWDDYFMSMAKLVSTRSKDDTTKVGAILVRERRIISTGYNGMPRGINDDVKERHERPAKYLHFEHAERNAVYNCAYEGVSSKGCKMYLTLFPCVDCARGIIQSGITEVIVSPAEIPKHWRESIEKAKLMLTEAGVRWRYHGDLPA